MDGHEAPVIADDNVRDYPQWSPDGMRLAYRRLNASTREYQIMVWSGQSHNEAPLKLPTAANLVPYDWSPDGERVLVLITM